MSENVVSVDEFVSARKDITKTGDVVMKAFVQEKAGRTASTWNPEKRTIRFVMSAEIEDRDKDIISQAGLRLKEFIKNPQAFYNHNARGFPVGHWTNVERIANDGPLRTEGTLNIVPEGIDEVADRLARHLGVGTIRACSIGFRPLKVKRREKPDGSKDDYGFHGYNIEESELVECSPVTIPSNTAALAKMAADGDAVATELIELVLDNWGKHPETGLIIPRSEFEASYKQATGDRISVTVASAEESRRFFDAWNKATEPEKPAECPIAPPQPETPPAAVPEAPAAVPEAPAGENPPAEQPLTEEQKDGLLTRLWKLFSSDTSEEQVRKLAEERRKAAEDAVRIAAQDEVRKQVREAKKHALQSEIRSLVTDLKEQGLV